MPSIGHNSVTGEQKSQLKSFVERIERVNEEIKSFTDDRKDIYAEAKANGFDTKAIRAIIKRRAADADKLREHEAIVETYRHALGDLADLPLGQAAIERVSASA